MNGNSNDVCTVKRSKPHEELISKQDVENAMRCAFGSSTKLIDYRLEALSDNLVGFMAVHRHLYVSIQREGSAEKELRKFFLKAIPYNIEQQAAIIEESKTFFKETNFYRLVVPELLKGLKDKSWIAQCYLIKDDALLFEDLKCRNFSLSDKFLDLLHLKSALTSLARLHAASIIAEKRLGKTFLQLYPDFFKEGLFMHTGRFSEWLRTGTEVACAVAKQLGYDSTDIPKVVERVYQATSASNKWRNVVCHGDAWSFNMMFDDKQPLPTCVLVDFQQVRYVPPVVDILQMFYLTTSRKFREEKELELLEHYHNVLHNTLKQSNEEVEVPSFNEILKMYEDLRVVGVVTATLYFPISLVDSKLSAQITKDSEGFAKLMYGDRVDFVLELMQKDDFYNEMITEIVTELVQRSKQLLL